MAWRSDWVPYRFNGALVRRRRWKRARKNKLTNDDLPDIKIEELVMRLRDPVHGIQYVNYIDFSNFFQVERPQALPQNIRRLLHWNRSCAMDGSTIRNQRC